MRLIRFRGCRAVALAGAVLFACALCAAPVPIVSSGGSPAAAPSAPPAEFIIQGGQVYPVSSEMVDGGAVWVKDGKIFQVGRIEAVQGGRIMTCVDGCALQVRDDMPVVNVGDAWIVPGLIDAGTTTIERARAAGVTSALAVPRGAGAGVLAGESALTDLGGGEAAEMPVKSPAGLHADLRAGPAPAAGATGGAPAQGATRAAALRGILDEARAYREKWVKYRKDLAAFESVAPQATAPGAGAPAPSGAPAAGGGRAGAPERPATDARLEALMPVVTGEIPLIIRAERAGEIQAALGIADEHGVRVILDGGTEAWKLAGEIADRRIPILLGPVTTQATGRGSQEAGIDEPVASYEGAARLQEAGARIALRTGEARPARRLAFETGLAVAAGLAWEDALRAVTLSPAELLGVDDRIGSLAIGREANILVTSGDRFEPATRVVQVYVRGVPVLSAGPRAEQPARRDAK